MKHFYDIPLNWFAYTDTGTLTGLVQTAYSKAVEFAFQPQLYFAQFSQTKTWNINERDPIPGDIVTFTIFNNLNTATGALTETADPTAEALGKTQKSVTLVERGKLVTSSLKIRVLSFANIDLAIGRTVGDNMGNSVDLIARAAFDANTGSTYIKYASGIHATAVLDSANGRMTAADVRYARNRLARNNVPKSDGSFYTAIIHPDVLLDLRAESGSGAWRTPKEYVDPSEIYNGEIGEFEGFRFVETSNANLETDGASGTVDLYTTYFFGWQAVAYAEGVAPAMGISGPFDAMQRLVSVFWYGLVGFGELRPEAMHKFYCSSSVGSN